MGVVAAGGWRGDLGVSRTVPDGRDDGRNAWEGVRLPPGKLGASQRAIKIVSRFSELIEALAEATGQFRQSLGPEEHQHNRQN